jgi:hypothetical protein
MMEAVIATAVVKITAKGLLNAITKGRFIAKNQLDGDKIASKLTAFIALLDASNALLLDATIDVIFNDNDALKQTFAILIQDAEEMSEDFIKNALTPSLDELFRKMQEKLLIPLLINLNKFAIADHSTVVFNKDNN